MRFLVRLLLSALVLLGVAYLSRNTLIDVDSFKDALYAAVILAVINATVKPVVRLLALPLRIATLGLFSFVLNAAFLYLVHVVVPGFRPAGFLAAMVAAVVISAATSLITWVARV